MKFSILIPAFKQKYLRECVESCLSQTYKTYEVIIVDDASPENLKSVVDKFDDPRIFYYRNEKNCGAVNVVDNWNICLSYATGDYVICIGDDDKLKPNCLEEYHKLIMKYPDIGLVHGWTEIIDEKSTVTKLAAHRCEHESVISLMWHRKHAYEYQFIGDFCFQRSWLVENGGFYKLPLAWGSDDISAYIGASKNGVANTQVPVFQYRVNAQTISSTGNIKIKMDAITAMYKWQYNFLSQPKESYLDELYRKELLKDMPSSYQKKCGLTIAQDMKHCLILRVLYWWYVRKRYKIECKTLLYAISQTFK